MSTKVFYLRDKHKNKVKGADSKSNKAKIVFGSQKCFFNLKKCFEISKKIVISKKVFGPKKCFGNSKHALGSKKIVDIVDNVAMLILLMQSGTTPGSN